MSELYLFYLIGLFNPLYSSCNNLLSFSVDKVTTGTYNFVSFISTIASVELLTAATTGSGSGSASLVALLVITQFLDQDKIQFITQLINVISSVLQELLQYFNGTAISTFFSVLLPPNPPVMLIL